VPADAVEIERSGHLEAWYLEILLAENVAVLPGQSGTQKADLQQRAERAVAGGAFLDEFLLRIAGEENCRRAILVNNGDEDVQVAAREFPRPAGIEVELGTRL